LAKAACEFQVFAKPIGAICNLDCRYCYYLEKEQLYPQPESFRMADDLLEEYIVQHIESFPGPAIGFSWHGGEPTVLGLEFFRKVVALQHKHRPAGRRITNGIQTNGVILDEEWCRFLAAEGFGVGLSLDGPQELHDRYRVTRGHKPTHKQALRGYKLLRRHRVPCDVLCVVNDFNVQYPTQVYRFFKEIGAEYLGFLPVVAAAPDARSGVSPFTTPAEAFGSFLCTIFDEWVREDIGRIRVQIFEEAARPAQGREHALCIFRETCGDIPVLEHNGDLFSCDHFVDAQHRLGNIRETPLTGLIEGPAQKAFGRAKRDALPRYCREGEGLPMCNGGCPKDRIIQAPDGEGGLNYLCAGFKKFFAHSLPVLVRLASLGPDLRAGKPGAAGMQPVAAREARTVGRNDPCPCGSGRKYKRCCLGTGSV
jgi:uncharacterized protein